MRDRGIRRQESRIGISDRAWAGNLLAFQAALPDASWLPASRVTSDLRAVKDETEIACLRAASAAADRVAASLQRGDMPLLGRTEAQVSEDISARLVEKAMHRSISRSSAAGRTVRARITRPVIAGSSAATSSCAISAGRSRSRATLATART